MSEPSTRDVIARVLGEHRFYWDGWFLNCPSCPDWRGRCDYDKELHRADALIAAGVTMPAEPEWGPDGSGSYGFGHDVSCDERGRVWLADNDMEPHEALGIAAALLGAANKAEGVAMPAPPEFDGRCQQPVATRGGRPCVLDIGHDGGCF